MICELVNALKIAIDGCIDDGVISLYGMKVFPYRFRFKKLPPKAQNSLAPDAAEIPDLPAIAIQFDDTTTEEPNSERGKIVRISLIVGLTNDNIDDGAGQVLNIAETLENYFTENPVVAGKFRLEYPVKIRLHEKPYPQHFAAVETDWNVPQAVADYDPR